MKQTLYIDYNEEKYEYRKSVNQVSISIIISLMEATDSKQYKFPGSIRFVSMIRRIPQDSSTLKGFILNSLYKELNNGKKIPKEFHQTISYLKQNNELIICKADN